MHHGTQRRRRPSHCSSALIHISATDPSYILSSSTAYFFSTTLRLTLRLGVSSPSSTDRSLGRIANCFTVSYFARLLLTSSKYGASSFLTSSVLTTSPYGLPFMPWSLAQLIVVSSSSVTSAVTKLRLSPWMMTWLM